MFAHRAAIARRQRLDQRNGIAFDDQIDVCVRAGQQQIAYKSAHTIQPQAHLLRLLANPPQQRPQRRRQRPFQPSDDLRPAHSAIGGLPPTIDQIGAGDNADQVALVIDDRDLSPTGAHHLLLQIMQRVVRVDDTRPLSMIWDTG